MRLFLAISLISFSVLAQPATPRKSPELTIVEPSGKQTLLSSYRGKVVALAFIFTTCPHCQAECGLMNKLQAELGPKGFQPLAVAFNDNAGMLLSGFVQNFHPTFPVGYAARLTVTDYLQLDDKDPTKGWNVPQIVLIDRKGMIVAQSAPKGSEELQEENSLRKRITDLLGGAKKSGH
jgi:thiol-disulfide isomerase/thioredoxin